MIPRRTAIREPARIKRLILNGARHVNDMFATIVRARALNGTRNFLRDMTIGAWLNS